MGAFRDHPRRGAALVAATVSRTGFALAAGSGAGFLLAVVGGVVGEEVTGRFSGVLDELLRFGVGATALAVLLGLGIGAMALGAARSAYAQQLAREAVTDASSVAPRTDRAIVGTEDPDMPVFAFAVIFLSIDVLAIALMLFAFAESAENGPEDAGASVAFAVVVALGVLTFALRQLSKRRWLPRWTAAKATIGEVWSARVLAETAASERARRSRPRAVEYGGGHRALTWVERYGTRAAGAVGAVGGVLFAVGLYARQQCRTCDPVYYGEPLENAIDVVMLLAAPLIALSLLLLVTGAVAAWLADVVAVRTLRRLADEGAPSPTAAQLRPVLTEATPAFGAATVVIAAAWGLVPVAVVAASLLPGEGFDVGAIALGAIGAVAVGVLAWSEGAGARVRSRLRGAWSPGDLQSPAARVRGRSRRGVEDRDRDGDDGGDGGGDGGDSGGDGGGD